MKTYIIAPCIPVHLPLKNLNRKSFSGVLKRAHLVLNQFDMCLPNLLLERRKGRTHRLPNSALEYVVSQKRVSFHLLCSLHALILEGSGASPDEVGKIRKRQNWIGPEKKGIDEAYFLPPDLVHLRKGLKNLQSYLSTEEDPLVQLAIYFAQLLILHPFMDGNGRVARLTIPIFLYQKKVISKPVFFMEYYFKKHRLDYFHKLYLISTKKQWEGWIRFFLQGIVEEGKRSLRDC